MDLTALKEMFLMVKELEKAGTFTAMRLASSSTSALQVD
jgi:hypothetical protein